MRIPFATHIGTFCRPGQNIRGTFGSARLLHYMVDYWLVVFHENNSVRHLLSSFSIAHAYLTTNNNQPLCRSVEALRFDYTCKEFSGWKFILRIISWHTYRASHNQPASQEAKDVELRRTKYTNNRGNTPTRNLKTHLLIFSGNTQIARACATLQDSVRRSRSVVLLATVSSTRQSLQIGFDGPD